MRTTTQDRQRYLLHEAPSSCTQAEPLLQKWFTTYWKWWNCFPCCLQLYLVPSSEHDASTVHTLPLLCQGDLHFKRDSRKHLTFINVINDPSTRHCCLLFHYLMYCNKYSTMMSKVHKSDWRQQNKPWMKNADCVQKPLYSPCRAVPRRAGPTHHTGALQAWRDTFLPHEQKLYKKLISAGPITSSLETENLHTQHLHPVPYKRTFQKLLSWWLWQE